MRSWVLVLLLAALLVARLRLGSAEGDPLPPSLVDLVGNSPVSSVEDLKLLLQQETNAIEEDEDEHDILSNHTQGRYIRSLVDAQPAQQAVCKVRTEVMEVTRSMLDRRNANFLLWPPCVEVQRCSGCCNTRLLQCVPTVTSSRYLQVIKIQYINKKAHYEKAIISVEDHVSCRCQTLSSSSSSSTSSSSSVPITRSNPIPAPPPPQQPLPSSHNPLPVPRPVQPSSPKTETDSQKEGNQKEEGSSANSGNLACTELANQGKKKDSNMTSEDGRLTEAERKQKLLELVQKEPDEQTHLHQLHPHQRPKPTTFKTAYSTMAPISPSARKAQFRSASPRRRRKHRKRISKAAMRAMIM
ncbi:platelet-derived growth factor beta polypeptide a isoform X3 [Archocentrus centrarchus]|uniref:platelet-derived growth factor beta polypeptide a isoform X3 n=1 Tax=Archocentrus centrarchus TaxID=63155 RepID=UPI0011EA10D1|nr:platelet-derived growth factor subunit B-like isoform X3 [Archocentrus centrarchus]